MLSSLRKRYQFLRQPTIITVLRIQDEILSNIRDFLRNEGYLEVLAPIIGPVTDPGIRGAKQATIDYYGTSFKVMSSMILYKQMAVRSLKKIFALSPNIRLESIETVTTGRHLAEFRQVDVEQARVTYHDVMCLAERLLRYVCQKITEKFDDELRQLNRTLKVPTVPFRVVTYQETLELLHSEGFSVEFGKEIPWKEEKAISTMFDEPFFIVDYPVTARGFYDREDPNSPGILRDFDLIYPEGVGEAASGGEREHTYKGVVKRMQLTGEDPAKYGWYVEMLKDGVCPSAGFGIGVERLTRWICGLKAVWDAVPFPKVPGIVSP
ncbi:MAG: asparagine synthetase A [Candidatus Bathyarchaeota archaeon]|nr:asparagine synthetase A [Candidatus Bathyarchaeota archaeon]